MITETTDLIRCFGGGDPTYEAYHDHEWATPVRGDNALYERLVLEGFQSGLSWLTILRKRDNFRAAFAGFDADAVARFSADDVERLLSDDGIVRNRLKIVAAITNAKAVVALREGGRSLTELVWAHAPTEPRTAPPASWDEVPRWTAESKTLAKELKQAGFVFVGPTTMYALMQACGLVNDHITGCVALR